MKKMTQKLMFLFLLLVVGMGYSQKVAVIGINHVGTDGFTFVVTQDLAAGEIIYFTENEYSDAANAFIDQAEATVTFTAGSAITKGNVVFVNETSTDTFTVTCTGGGTCGTAVKVGTSGNFALATDGETLYGYSDTDSNPTNGITTIHCVMYTGGTEPTIVNGGNIPADQNPSGDYPTAIVVDGFDPIQPNRTEFFQTTGARTNVSKVMLENPNNYDHGVANVALSTIFFTNLNLVTADPVATVSATPSSVNENSGTGMVYTFSLSAPAPSNRVINFTVGGSAVFGTDYSQSGATSFNTTTGSVTILSGNSSATVTLTPIGDSTLEANETISLTLASGTGYVAGSPGSASTTIINDDSLAITPIVAITGLHESVTNEGFSFVALQNLTAGTVVYFTENAFNNSSLTFSGTESVIQWTVPAGGAARGQVYVATETSADTFTTTCSSGTCGNVTVVSGNFSLATTGEEFYAYLDSDNNPLNGVTSVQAVMYTGSATTSGGIIPASQDPGISYPGAVVVDDFPAVGPLRTEYNPALRGATVDRANFQNPANWIHAQSNVTLSTVPFANIIISTGTPNPFASVSVSPSSVLENSGTAMAYTFSLTAPASGNITVNFSVSGSATYTSDYTASGASSFTTTTGSVVIPNGASSATVQITPVGDTALEVQESVVLTITGGTGYDGGSPNSATGFINNDDTSDSDPIVAIVGMSHADPDAFSFVAAQDIAPGTVIYFTDNSFSSSTLLFSSGEAVIRWTSPGTTITRGNVVVVTESAPDSFTVTCSNGTCGSVTLMSGNLAIATLGETLYAYEDNDANPSNGVTDIYSVLYTGNSSVSGGNIPAIEDPSNIFLSALVVDGFPSSPPARTEYDPTKRGVAVTAVNFEDTSNWVHAQSSPALSTVPFANIDILDDEDPVAICQNISVTPNVGTGSVTITAAAINNGSTDNIGISSYSINIDTFTCANVGTPVLVTLTVTDAAGNSDTCTATVTVLPNTPSTFTQIDPICAGGTINLPTTSNNGFTGTWSPAVNNMATTLYTFTPNAGQCGQPATMTVVVNPSSSNTTVVDACDSYTWSVNGVTYTQSGTYTVTTGCNSEILELTINVTPVVTIDTPAAVCEGATLTLNAQVSGGGFVQGYSIANWALTNSNADGFIDTAAAPASIALTGGNNGSGTSGNTDYTTTIPATTTLSFNWNYSTGDGAQFDIPRVVINGAETNMTGFDTGGSDFQSGTMSVSVTAGDTFAFRMHSTDNVFGAATVTISNFQYSAAPTLLWTATNGGTIVGANNGTTVDVTTSGTYTLTASNGSCTAFDSVDVTFTPNVTPTFAQVSPICAGGTFTLPTTSDNGITGTWAPAIDNTATTLYTFTPDSGQCATTATMTVVVNPVISPTFDPVADICSGDALTALPITSTNGVTGTWAPALNNTATTTYTFTPSGGQCANPATLTIVVNPLPIMTCPADITVCGSQAVSYTVSADFGSIDVNLTQSTSNVPVAGGGIACNVGGDNTFYRVYDLPALGYSQAMNLEAIKFSVQESGTPLNVVVNAYTLSGSLLNENLTLLGSTTVPITTDPLTDYSADMGGLAVPAGSVLVVSYSVPSNFTFVFNPGANPAGQSGPSYISTNDCGIPQPTDLAAIGFPSVHVILDVELSNPSAAAGTLVMDSGLASGSVFPVGTTVVSYTATSAAGCVSTCSFNVTVNSTPAPTGSANQSFSSGATLANVMVSGSNIQWYTAANGGTLLPSSTVLVNGTTYYATQTLNGCESTTFAVTVSVGTGVTNVIATQCGTTLAAYGSIVYANVVPNAQMYRFRVTHLGTNQVITKDYVLRNLYLSSLAFYRYDQTYSIEVAVRRNNIWEPYGVSCNVTTPIAYTQVRASQCGQVLASKNELVYADIVSATNGYRFRVTNTLTNSVQIIDRPTRVFPFSLVTDYSIGTVYHVDVAVMNTDGLYLPYGPVCNVITPGAPFKESLNVKVTDAIFTVVGAPNPFSENFKLNLATSSVEPVNISIYDMLGKLIETRELSTVEVENYEAGANYPNGVYNIIVSQGDNVKSLRMVKR